MANFLGDALRKAFDKVTGAAALGQAEVDEFKKDIQRALITSDVNIKTVMEVSKAIEKKALEKIPGGLSRKEFLVKGTYDELVRVLKGEKGKEFEARPGKVLLVGLFGSGKTTSIGKLARWYQKKGHKVGVVCADIWRPAAYEQLKQYVSQLKGVPCYGDAREKDPVKLASDGVAFMESEKCDVVLVDSAGRSGLDEELVEEIKKINNAVKPSDTFMIISADIGQSAGKQAEAFHNAIGVTGVILTKMDGSAKGGGAISACSATGAPVVFIGVGEKIEDLEAFDAPRYLSRVMGYGDLAGLIEKAKEVVGEEDELNAEELLEKGLTLDLFYKQMKAARKMGPLGKVMELMGVKQKLPDDVVKVGEKKLNSFQFIMDSMTKKERGNVDLIDKKRIARIAKGSGTREEDVRELLKSYKHTEKMFRMMRGGKMRGQLAKLAKAKGLDFGKLMGQQ
ncbi:MAG TPA: signal recognition particle receptor subunit alpha [archaeon]|nr:signal recognition particle receptor subunit alpha [archaeon]HLD81050.1 signal recognition particle receptor subunit alpha [archaeon]